MALTRETMPLLAQGSPTHSRYRAFHPGAEWLDTAGKPIQAHAGSLIAVGDNFYWYGENKEFTTGKGTPQSWGIRFYRSHDLYNWEDLGPIIPPVVDDPSSPLSSATFPERPHILYNPRTQRYVCWIKVRGQGAEYRLVMVADKITGPYRIMQKRLQPAGMAAGDFDIVADPVSGRAYMYFEHDHKELVCIDLTDDWCDVTGRISRHFPSSAPDTKEGIACFRRNGRLYLTASSMTGYFPNPSSVEVAEDVHGPFRSLGDLHPNDRSRTSYNSQISCIFKHPRKKDLYIAMADRWLPRLSDLTDEAFLDGRYSTDFRSAVRKVTAKPPQAPTPGEVQALQFVVKNDGTKLVGLNTSISRYVWLPLRFDGERPVIGWRDEWRVEDFT
jgi:hypothetical protein